MQTSELPGRGGIEIAANWEAEKLYSVLGLFDEF